VRFYKGPSNTGTHVGSLWTNTGTLLARATFANETSSGWQQVRFDNPVAVTAGATYIVSYHAPNGKYSADVNYFANRAVDNPPLHALQDSASGRSGVYLYGSGGFPTESWSAASYWVDVVFTTGAPQSPPNQTPTANAGADQSLILTAGQTSVSVTLDGSGSSDPDGTIKAFTGGVVSQIPPIRFPPP
jgi:hypothetical protein